MSDHTPWPWETTDGTAVYALNEGQTNRFFLSIQGGWRDDNDSVRTSTDELIANARLIAAAPDMLAALQEIEQWCTNAKRGTGIEPYGLSIARAAIAKATGGA